LTALPSSLRRVSFDAASETDLGILRQAVKLLESENQRLMARVAELTRELAAARGQDAIAAIQLELAGLQQQLERRNQMLFGSSSEKRGGSKGKRSRDEGPRDEDRHVGGARRHQPNLLVEPVVHDLDPADRVCNACGGSLEEWTGKTEDSEEIDCIARRFVIKKHVRKVYRCRCGCCIETAPAPLKLHPGARYSIDFAIEVAIDKYRDHQPLERQVRAMKQEGLIVDSQTLFDQCARLAQLLKPAYAAVGALLRSRDVLGGDETRWPVYGAKGSAAKASKWHAWILASDDAVYYEVHDSRGADAARRVLGNFRGTLIVDGHSAYVSVEKSNEGLALANCWAHCRREYLDIEKGFPKETQRILHLIGLLYRIEERAGPGRQNDARRLALRRRRSRVVIKAIERWALSVVTTPDSGLSQAIKYMARRWTPLCRFIDEPRIPLDNNGSERGLRGLVLGRKNHYGSKSRRGAEVAATLYTLIETCKLIDVDPRRYLRAATEAALRSEPMPLPHDLASST